MTDDDERPAFGPAAVAEQFGRAGERLTASQLELFERLLTGATRRDGTVGGLHAASREAAVFKTRVQSGGRLSIPDAEREALGIDEGDLVQAFVVPIETGDNE
jgi:hypothetical protein